MMRAVRVAVYPPGQRAVFHPIVNNGPISVSQGGVVVAAGEGWVEAVLDGYPAEIHWLHPWAVEML